MSAVNRIRLGLLVVAGLMTAGCGRGAPAPLDSIRSRAPRRIELPADLRPLIPARAAENVVADPGSIRVEYQQPQSPTASRPAFNVELAATPQSSGASPVREPLAAPPPAVNDAPAAPPQRSQFIPISMPQSSTAPGMSQAPTMPPAASFVTAAPASNGPQLSSPVNSADPSPLAGQFKTPAEP